MFSYSIDFFRRTLSDAAGLIGSRTISRYSVSILESDFREAALGDGASLIKTLFDSSIPTTTFFVRGSRGRLKLIASDL